MKQKITLNGTSELVVLDYNTEQVALKNSTQFLNAISNQFPIDFGLLPPVVRYISIPDKNGTFYVVIEGKPVMRNISTYNKKDASKHKAFLVPVPWHTWILPFEKYQKDQVKVVNPKIYFHYRQASSLDDYLPKSDLLKYPFLSNCRVDGSICWYTKGTVFKSGTDFDQWYKNLMNEFWAESFNSSCHPTTDIYVKYHKIPLTDNGYNSYINSLLDWLSTKDLDFVVDEKFFPPIAIGNRHHIPSIGLNTPTLSLDTLFQSMR